MNTTPNIIPHSKPWITKEDHSAVIGILSSGMIAQGDEARNFERMVSNFFDVAGGVAAGSGTAALTLSLLGIGIKPSDEVIIPTYTCNSVLDAVRSVGAIPVLCDIGNDWVLTSETAASKFTDKTAAIVAVHTFGIAVDLSEIISLGPPVIEDCSQSFGKATNRLTPGNKGALAVFSFQATKYLTTGEGGMVISNNLEILNKIKAIRDGELDSPLRLATPMTDIQAALGISQLKRYDTFLHRRIEIAARYLAELKNCSISLPDNLSQRSLFFRFPIRINDNFVEVRNFFKKHGIAVRRGVDKLLHRQLNMDRSEFSKAEELYRKTLSLPIYPALTAKEQSKVIRVCRKLWG